MIGRRPLKRLTRYIASRMLSKTVILLYHRVNSLPNDPQKLCVSPSNFDAHLSIIKKHYYPISLQRLCNDIKCKKVVNNGVVITFDDGYADNFFNAKPILEKYNMPATVFTVADWVNSQREFFWDDLFRILITTPDLPKYLEIEINKKKHAWDLSDHCESKLETSISQPTSMWDVEQVDDPTPKHRIYRELCQIIRDLDPNSRERVLNDLCIWAGIKRIGRTEQQTLRIDELTTLEDSGLIKVGAHTLSHSLLSKLPLDEQRYEIFESKQKLERLIGHSVSSFSYPWGGHNDYNETSIKLVKEVGFNCSCSNFPGVINRWSDPFQLPRFIVRDWNGEEFEQQLHNFFSL